MADAYSSRPQSSDSDGPPRPPTFVQIRPPVAPGSAARRLGIAGVCLVLVVAASWGVYRAADEPPAVEVAQAAPPVTDIPPVQPPPADLHGELARLAIDAAAFTPTWTRESLMDRLSPFDLSVAVRTPSSAPPADTGSETKAGSSEVSVQLGKGDTIASALKRLGFSADTITDVIAALAPHVRLKRLPIGLDMTVQIGPPPAESATPILQALTLHPEVGREIKVERDGDGNYAVERPGRSSRN